MAGSCVEAKLRARSDVRQTCSAHRGAGKQSFVVVDGIETYTHTHTQGYHNIIKHIIKRATYSEDRII